MSARDEQFLEAALASGNLDLSRARQVREARAVQPSDEPIERWVIRANLVHRDAVARILACARARGSGAGRGAPPAAAALEQTFDATLEAQRPPDDRTELDFPGEPPSGSVTEVDDGLASRGAVTEPDVGLGSAVAGEASFAAAPAPSVESNAAETLWSKSD